MGSQIADYTFTIIEDAQVPLAGNFETHSFAPVYLVVALGLLMLALLAYALWFETHSVRIKTLSGDAKTSYFFHPAKLLREERELEYSLVEAPVKG
ncbi:MAG: hypothetical protein Q4D29_02620 [Lachnospiraceae bacterium]|nr:hypothetical protein [Lachnospiraceae bacterium]